MRESESERRTWRVKYNVGPQHDGWHELSDEDDRLRALLDRRHRVQDALVQRAGQLVDAVPDRHRDCDEQKAHSVEAHLSRPAAGVEGKEAHEGVKAVQGLVHGGRRARLPEPPNKRQQHVQAVSVA